MKGLLGLSLLLCAACVWPANLGRMAVYSALGEPFRADVEVLNASPDELASLTAKMASAEMFRRNGVDFTPAALAIRATLVSDSTRTVIRLRSAEGMQEPVLDLLLDLSSDKGSMVKKFTVLLDPPIIKPSAAELSLQDNAAFAAGSASSTGAGQAGNLVSSTPSSSMGSTSSMGIDPSGRLNLKTSLSLNLNREALSSIPASRELGRRSKTTRLEPSLPQASEQANATQSKRQRKKRDAALAQRTAKQDTLTVLPSSATQPKGEETPQALARRLVKSGVSDPAKIEALILALNALNTSAATPNAAAAPSSNAVKSTQAAPAQQGSIAVQAAPNVIAPALPLANTANPNTAASSGAAPASGVITAPNTAQQSPSTAALANASPQANASTPINAASTTGTTGTAGIASTAPPTTTAPISLNPDSKPSPTQAAGAQSLPSQASTGWDQALSLNGMVALLALGLLGLLAWLVIARRARAAEEAELIEDFEALPAAKAKTANNAAAQALIDTRADQTQPYTQFFETQLYGHAHTKTSVTQVQDIEPIAHIQSMLSQGETRNAASMLHALLLETPNDHAVRLMLIRLRIDQRDDAALTKQMQILETLTTATGEHWEKAQALQHDYWALKQNKLDFAASTEPAALNVPPGSKASSAVQSNQADDLSLDLGLDLGRDPEHELNQRGSDHFPNLDFDLGPPTVFAAPTQPGFLDLSSLDFKSEAPRIDAKYPAIDLVSPPKANTDNTPMPAAELAQTLAALEAHLQKNELAGAKALLKQLTTTVSNAASNTVAANSVESKRGKK